MTNTKYTETDTENYYDSVGGEYLVNWNEDGSMHWGYFEDLDAPCGYPEFRQASVRWNEYMLKRSGISSDSKVLDLCCGNGNNSVWIAQQIGCEVVGVDLSATHIENARSKARSLPSINVTFEKASITKMPFPENFFTHVWCQASLFQVHDRAVALAESYRVLKSKGIFIFDDMIKRVSEIGESTRQHLYERILISELFTPESYLKQLSQLGFNIIDDRDLSLHMRKSYEIQFQRHQNSRTEVSLGYQKTKEAIEAGEIGWWFFLCEK